MFYKENMIITEVFVGDIVTILNETDVSFSIRISKYHNSQESLASFK